jgi:DNA invertase Pin-like site-specific DNA recombinase
MNGTFIAYYRVSTEAQGRSGLGLEAQREAVTTYLNGGRWTLAAEYVEVESGKREDRPQLVRALAQCRLTGATLVVAKLDRLARNAHFLLTVLKGASEAGVVFCDLPNIPAGPTGRFLLTSMAAVAELEAGLISQRTKAALKAAKARGVKLGGFRGVKVDPSAGSEAQRRAADAFAERLAGIVVPLRADGMSLADIAATLTARGVRTARGGAWTAAAVRNVLLRLDAAAD